MDKFFGVLIVIAFLFAVLGPVLRRWFAPMLQRWAMGRMEDTMRRMAGMPTRKEEKKARRKSGQRRDGNREASSRFRNARRQPPRRRSTIGMLRYVAEDVEFTEIKEFDDGSVITHTTKVTYREEEQVEDAEFTELTSK